MWQQEQREAQRCAAAAAATAADASPPPRPPLQPKQAMRSTPHSARSQQPHEAAATQAREWNQLNLSNRRAEPPPPPPPPSLHSTPQRGPASWSRPVDMQRPSQANPSALSPPYSLPPPRLASLARPSVSFAAVVSRAALTNTYEQARMELATARQAHAETTETRRLQPLVWPSIAQPKQRSPDSNERKQPLESQQLPSPPIRPTAALSPEVSPLIASAVPLSSTSTAAAPDVPFSDLFSTDGAHLGCRFRAVDLQAFLEYTGLKGYYNKLLQCDGAYHTLASVRFVPRSVLQDVGMTSVEIGVLCDAVQRMEWNPRDDHVPEEKYDPGRPKTKAIEHVSRGVCALRHRRSRTAAAAALPSSADVHSVAQPTATETKRSSPFVTPVTVTEDAKMDGSPASSVSSTEAAPRFAHPMPPLELPPAAIKPPSHTPPPPPPMPHHWQQPPSKSLYVMQHCGPRAKAAESAAVTPPLPSSPHAPLAPALPSAPTATAPRVTPVASTSTGSGLFSSNLDALIAQQMQGMELSFARRKQTAVPAANPVAVTMVHPAVAAAQPAAPVEPPLRSSSAAASPVPGMSAPSSLLQRMEAMHRRLELLCASDGVLSSMEAAQSKKTAKNEQKQPVAPSEVLAPAAPGPAAVALPPPITPPPKPHPPLQPHCETDTVSSARRRRLRGLNGSWKPPTAAASSSSGRSSNRRSPSPAASSSRLPTANERRFLYDEQRRQQHKQAQQAHCRHSSQQHPQHPQTRQPHAATHAHAAPTFPADLSSCPKRKAAEAGAPSSESNKKARATDDR